MLRQNVRKSLVEKCVTSMKRVLGEAEKHKLIKEPPAAATGGVFIVPKELPEEIQRKIFDDPDYAPGQQTSMSSIWWYVLSVVSFQTIFGVLQWTKKSANDDEAVGYGRPPKASQFKKGQSGNPGGRPPKTPGQRVHCGPGARRDAAPFRAAEGRPRSLHDARGHRHDAQATHRSGHAAASALYMKFVERHGTQQAPDQPIGYIVIPEAIDAGRVGSAVHAERRSAG